MGNVLTSSHLPQEWEDAEEIFSSMKQIGKKIGQIEFNKNFEKLEKYLIKTDDQGKKEIQNSIEKLKDIKSFNGYDWNFMKEKVYSLFKVASMIEKLSHEEKSSTETGEAIKALNNFYIAFAWMKRSEKQEDEGADQAKKVIHLKIELEHLTDLYSIWKKLVTFYLKLFLTQENFSNSNDGLEKAKAILDSFEKYDQNTPLEECDSFHEIYAGYLDIPSKEENEEGSKFGLEGLFRLIKDNVLEKIIQASGLSFNELFSIKIKFQDLIEGEKNSYLGDYQSQIYSSIRSKDLKQLLQESEKDRLMDFIMNDFTDGTDSQCVLMDKLINESIIF